MSLSVEQIEMLVGLGASAQDILAFARSNGKQPRSKAAERTARWRDRRAGGVTESVTSDGHSDASHPPIDNTHTPLVSSNDETARPARPKKSPPANLAAKPDDVTEATWRDFSALRRKKGGPVSETALDGIREEATKAGWTLEAALKKCVTRNWQGFEAHWLGETKAGQPAQNDDFMAHMARKSQGVPSG